MESLLVTAFVVSVGILALYLGLWRKRKRKAQPSYVKLCTVITPESLVRLLRVLGELKVDFYVDVAKNAAGRQLVQVQGEDAPTDVFVSEKDQYRSKALLNSLRADGLDC